jgi:hypothetical protein
MFGTALLMLAACGSTQKLPEATSGGALTTSDVDSHINQTGDAPATIDQSSVTFKVDDSGSLVVRLRLMSSASSPATFAVRGSLYDSGGNIIGDATGGEVNVDPGATASIELNGPPPHGTIASATFEVTSISAPTPTPPTPAPTPS